LYKLLHITTTINDQKYKDIFLYNPVNDPVRFNRSLSPKLLLNSSTRLAARIGDIAKYPERREPEKQVALARRDSDFEEYFRLSMFPEKMREVRNSRKPENEATCTMCGDFCAMERGFALFEDDISGDKCRNQRQEKSKD
jgi:hypothetical protein